MCSQMPETMKPMANPATPDAKPPTKAAMRKSESAMPSTANSSKEGANGAWMAMHLEGRPRCPLIEISDYQVRKCPTTIDLFPRKETVLGLKAPESAGRPPKAPLFCAAVLLDHHPGWLQQRISYQADHRGGGDQQRIVDLPAEQHRERAEADQRGEPIADGDAPEQDAGAENRSDGRRVGAAHETLDVRIGAVPCQDRRRPQDEDERRKENTDGRNQRAPETGEQITDEGRGDHHRAGTDHADRHRDQELPLIQPAVLLHQALLEERHDDKAAAKGERTGLEEER